MLVTQPCGCKLSKIELDPLTAQDRMCPKCGHRPVRWVSEDSPIPSFWDRDGDDEKEKSLKDKKQKRSCLSACCCPCRLCCWSCRKGAGFCETMCFTIMWLGFAVVGAFAVLIFISKMFAPLKIQK